MHWEPPPRNPWKCDSRSSLIKHRFVRACVHACGWVWLYMWFVAALCLGGLLDLAHMSVTFYGLTKHKCVRVYTPGNALYEG